MIFVITALFGHNEEGGGSQEGDQVDDTGQLPSVFVLPVVVEELGEGDQVGQGEQEAEYLEPGLSAELLVLWRRTHGAGLQFNNPLTGGTYIHVRSILKV